jgi:nucleotide-binding universal stress UspA family protein
MRPVLLATDGSPSSAAAETTAIELARALGAPLLVAAIWRVAYQSIAAGSGPLLPQLDEARRRKALSVANVAADTAHAAGVASTIVVRGGVPAQEICAIAKDEDAQLIVLGAHGWGAIGRTVFGSVSTAVLHHSGRPVLVVPAGAALGDRLTHLAGDVRSAEPAPSA